METRRRLLGGILTLVCFALCSGIADAACRDTAFSCKDGSKCLLIYRKCNGVAQCRDRSDEDPDMCGKAATARIALGEVLRAKVQYKAEHESVQFILCDGSSCGGFDVEGATSGGDLAFTSSEDENPMGDYGNEVNSSRPSDFHVFPTGELLFEVERRLHEVVVWLSGHKDKSISAPVKQNSSLLRVKPLAWHSDMPVELSVQQNVCGEYGFLCANGQCRQITDKCDGVKQCADGSDEDVAMCNSSVSGACGKGKFECKNKECKPIGVRCDGRKDCSDGSDEDLVICNTADSTDIHLGAVLTTKVQYKPEHEAIEFHLCGGQRCGVLRVMGVGSTGQLAYKSFTGANAMGAYGTLHSEKGPAQWVHWPADEVVFEVERRLTDMAVWLRGHNDSKVSVPATEDSSLLRVRPAVWGSNMHAQFTSSPNACGDFGFPCANGECRPVTDKCNGVPQCSDRSDEYTDLCDSIPETTLSVGDSRSVHVQHKKSHGAIYFTLCEEKSCKTVDILGSAPSGALDYVTYTCPGASKFFGCTEAQRGQPPSSNALGDKGYDFYVEKSASETTVYLKDHPEFNFTIPGTVQKSILQVKPTYWKEDMPVLFNDVCKSHEFRCSNSQCIRLALKCSGEKECDDGSDEYHDLCKLPEKSMSVGDVVTVRVQFLHEFEGISFLLCDANTCSKIAVDGSAPDGALAYVGLNGCNSQGANWCRKERSARPVGWRRFSPGEVAFEVQRRPAELAVWLRGYPLQKAAVLVWPGSDQLRVRPYVWRKNMDVEFDGPHCGNAPLSPVAYTVNGEEAAPGFFPWHAGIYKKTLWDHKYICGGSLVSRTAVISVAHCFVENRKVEPAENFAVGLGKIFKDWDHEEIIDVFKSDVKRVIVHHLYRGVRRNFGDDVAIVQLAQAAEISSYIQPICINEELIVNPGEVFRVVGWGGNLEKLESVTFKLQSKSSCLDSIKQSPHEESYITTDKFCSLRESGAGQNATGLAKGDSGGGAVTKRGDRWFLVGLVSVGLKQGKVYAFTDMSTHNNWRTRITDEIESKSNSR